MICVCGVASLNRSRESYPLCHRVDLGEYYWLISPFTKITYNNRTLSEWC